MEASTKQADPQLLLSISCTRLCRVAGLITCGLTYSNVAFACFGTIDCEEYLPSLSYIWAFRGHDRTAVATGVFYALVLMVFFLGVFAGKGERLSTSDKGLMLGIGIGIVIIVPVIAILDGHIGLYGVGMRSVHYFSVYYLVILTVIWLCLALPAIPKRQPLLKWSLTTAVLLTMTLVEWELCNSVYHGLLFNQTLFTLCQWSTVTAAVFLPAAVCQTYGDFHVCLEFDAAIEEESIEL